LTKSQKYDYIKAVIFVRKLLVLCLALSISIGAALPGYVWPSNWERFVVISNVSWSPIVWNGEVMKEFTCDLTYTPNRHIVDPGKIYFRAVRDGWISDVLVEKACFGRYINDTQRENFINGQTLWVRMVAPSNGYVEVQIGTRIEIFR